MLRYCLSLNFYSLGVTRYIMDNVYFVNKF